MAKEIIDTSTSRYVVITRKEACDIIGLLAAQLADEALISNMKGQCPEILIENKLYRMFIVIKD